MTQNLYASMNSTLSGQTLFPNQLYPSYAAVTTVQPEHQVAMDSITDSLGNVNLRNGSYNGQDGQDNGYAQANSHSGAQTVTGKEHNQYPYQMSDLSFPQPGPSPTQSNFRNYSHQYSWPAMQGSQYYGGQYLNGSFQTYGAAGIAQGPNTPRGQQWLASQSIPPVPELYEPRRTSWSSRDEASPHTPTFGPGVTYAYRPGQSPTTFSTPSPMSASHPYYPHIWKNPDGTVCVVDFYEIMFQEPAVPEPVPALRSGPDGGRGTLDKILDNRDGQTNVYVRGLLPTTTDEMLQTYGERFGTVDTCKSIIDASTGHCKGFGFIKYHNFIDAENCIRGFYHRGYEAKFARKSHNSRLKDLSSPENTNLYVSNLPRLINEEGLKLLFQNVFPEETYPHHQAGSCKILKDTCGVSRGVGFARFETPAICNEIIKAFDNREIGEDNNATKLQIRYADTEEQKHLKAFTAVKRQFKADEYNEAVYGTPFSSNYSPTAPSFQSPYQGRAQGINGSWLHHSPASSISPPGLNNGNYQYSVLRSRQPSNIGRHPAPRPVFDTIPPSNDRHAAHITIESPSVTAAAKKAAVEAVEDGSTDGGSSSRSGDATLVENMKPVTAFSKNELVVSPTKAKL